MTRLGEELGAAANREVVVVTGTDDDPPRRADLYVGTEAALYRVGPVDVVAFLEFDSEMLAPRFRASEQATGTDRARRTPRTDGDDPDLRPRPRGAPGRTVPLTPDIVVAAERKRRHMLGLPPYGALASVTGAFSEEVVVQLDREKVQVGGDGQDRYLLRASDWVTLGTEVNATTRPPGSRVRVAVDPPRI